MIEWLPHRHSLNEAIIKYLRQYQNNWSEIFKWCYVIANESQLTNRLKETIRSCLVIMKSKVSCYFWKKPVLFDYCRYSSLNVESRPLTTADLNKFLTLFMLTWNRTHWLMKSFNSQIDDGRSVSRRRSFSMEFIHWIIYICFDSNI